MLNKKNRISNRQLIEKLFKKGRFYKNNYFLFRFSPSIGTNSQFAVVVSKKVAVKAVDRNHLRREINEIIRNNLHLLKKNIISLIIANKNTEKADHKELSKGIEDFFNQNKLHE